MKPWLRIAVIGLLALVLVAGGYTWYRFRDRHPGYEVDLNLKPRGPARLQAGFGKCDITPLLPDKWTDKNGDAVFSEKDGDTYTDGNGNGRFDPVWLAGFQSRRPAQGINDPLWARALVLDDGHTRMALCVIDAIGFGNDEVIAARKRIPDSLGLDYVIIASTHAHSTPDLMGMWGPAEWKSGVNPAYREQTLAGIATAVSAAAANLRPAKVRFAEDPLSALPMVGDTRDPQVFDAAVRVMHLQDAETGATLGALLNWGNHPETMWWENLLITSDFAHYFRQYVEEGIYAGDSLIEPGLGGMAIFLNGALGGLMTTHPSIPVRHPVTSQEISEESIEKIDAQGMSLAKIALEALAQSASNPVSDAGISLRARTLHLRLDNKLFLLAAWLGVFDRGFSSWGKIRSEVCAWRLGEATFLHGPGELYPEILHGGVEAPEGADFGIAPVETPSLKSFVRTRYAFFGGMSNDMIGYIVPKSQWDAKPPFTYGLKDRPYGEINSLGPETGPAVYRALFQAVQQVNP